MNQNLAAKRIRDLPPYLFAELDRAKAALRAEGKDIIDLGVGDPDLPTPEPIVHALSRAAAVPANHRYPGYEGLLAFREAVAKWYQKRFGVELDPVTEVVSLIGSKEGIAHLPLAVIDPGDVGLYTDPGYPVYKVAISFAGGIPVSLPLTRQNRFLPDLEAVPEETARRAKILYVNYPNNPTAATAEKRFFERVVDFAHRHRILVCHDAAYSEIAFDGYRPASFLEIDGAKEVGIEFHSLSKTYSMTGWRVGFCVGNEEAIAALGKVKTNIDSGLFQAIQYAGIEALERNGKVPQEFSRTYQERRDQVVEGLRACGLDPFVPKATFYVWCPVPGNGDSRSFARTLLLETGVVVTPGVGFGEHGEGYFRVSLTAPSDRLEEALFRLQQAADLFAEKSA
ncbi:MAG: LL-diaminopimelate aminotransferase [bacterium]